MQVTALLALLVASVSAGARLQWGTRTEMDEFIVPGEYETYKNEIALMMREDNRAHDYVIRHHLHHFWDLFRLTYKCPAPMVRLPAGTADGGKWTCNADKLTAPCIVYSFGSEGNYMFEQEMSKFGCQIHTFDCFGEYGGNLPPNTRFHKWCVGGSNEVRDTRRYFTIPTIMRILKHSKVDFLKMDIEGGEYDSLGTMMELPKEALPWQLAVEVHQWNGERNVGQLRQSLKLWQQLDGMGYRVVGREDNTPAPCCAEFVWVRPEGMPKSADENGRVDDCEILLIDFNLNTFSLPRNWLPGGH